MGIVDIEKFVEKDEIRESNILIGEFLGWKLECLNPEKEPDDKVWVFNKYENGEITYSDSGGDSWSWDESGSLPFHANWNRLMDAYIKISGMASLSAIEEKVCYIQVGGTYSSESASMINCDFSVSHRGKDLKESVWLVVVDFVKWYNKQNKK